MATSPNSAFESSYATFNDMAVILAGRAIDPSVSSTSTAYPETTPVPQDTYHPLRPARILDTRDGIGGAVRQLGPGATMDIQVGGQGGVPSSGVSSVALNVTATMDPRPAF